MAEVLNLGLYYLDKAVTNLGYQRKDVENYIPTEATESVKVKVADVMAVHGSRFFLRLGGLSGAVAVSMAAYGAHAFKVGDEKETQLKKTFETGNKMHLIHSLALLCTPLCGKPYLMILYRLLRGGEEPSIGLHAKDPYSLVTVEDHVTHGSHGVSSLYISCSKSLGAIKNFASMSYVTPKRLVEICIEETDYHINVIDLTESDVLDKHIPFENHRGRYYASHFQEVLIEGHIPSDKIIREWEI